MWWKKETSISSEILDWERLASHVQPRRAEGCRLTQKSRWTLHRNLFMQPEIMFALLNYCCLIMLTTQLSLISSSAEFLVLMIFLMCTKSRRQGKRQRTSWQYRNNSENERGEEVIFKRSELGRINGGRKDCCLGWRCEPGVGLTVRVVGLGS